MTGLGNTTLYNEDMKGITTDNSSFELFRKYDALYVDKTEFICRLLSVWPKRFFFISRPRRFGKSLFCDTLKNVFEGNKKLFRGLYIYDKHDFEPYPVLSFNFAGQSISSIERFTERIAWNIKRYGKIYGVDIPMNLNIFQTATATTSSSSNNEGNKEDEDNSLNAPNPSCEATASCEPENQGNDATVYDSDWLFV